MRRMAAAPSSRVPRTCSSTANQRPCSATGPTAAASRSAARATSSSTANRRRGPAISPRAARASNAAAAGDGEGNRMRVVPGLRRWRSIVAAALLITLSVAAGAQQASKELADLRETASALYKSGDFAQSLQFYERATPLVIRDFGAEHEQTAIHYHSLGLVAEAA